MAAFLADLDLLHSINQALACSNNYLFIVSPYIDVDADTKKVFSELHKDVVKTIIYKRI